MIWAKRRKEAVLEETRIKEMEANNRRLFVETQWSYDQTDSFMRYRANNIFEGKFTWDQHNKALFMLLCFYFSNDIQFVSLAESMGVKGASLEKGLLLGGMIGVGKTWMMQLFGKNQRQVFALKTAKAIADTFQSEGEGSLDQFISCPKLPVNDTTNFFHSKIGLCIDDIGTEELKNHYGNRKNVIGDLIELRYSAGNCGTLLHLTTNLTMSQVKEFYGDRVGSRLRETMNIIELKGEDRRK
jgi:DNA replication protein DnaC